MRILSDLSPEEAQILAISFLQQLVHAGATELTQRERIICDGLYAHMVVQREKTKLNSVPHLWTACNIQNVIDEFQSVVDECESIVNAWLQEIGEDR